MTTLPSLAASPSPVAHGPNSRGSHGSPEFMVGQTVNIKVQQRLDEQHYLAVMRGEVRKVYSERPLPVGETVDTVVVSVVDKLELRQIASESKSSMPAPDTQIVAKPTDYSDMRSVARFYRCNFTASELTTLQSAVDRAPNAEQMALAGLILNKRGIAVQPALLNALYDMQSGTHFLQGLSESVDVERLTQAPFPTVAGLGQLMRQALQEQASVGQKDHDQPDTSMDIDAPTDTLSRGESIVGAPIQTSSQDAGGDDRPRQQIFQLLNDLDTEGMGVRYGTLPVLIDGRLVELELVMFHQPPRDSLAAPLRRLVMSVHTNTLGTVQIAAEALNHRLMIKISSESLEHTEALATYVDEVSDLVRRFGWSLESVGYEVRTEGGRLAQRVIEHGVRQGVIDNVW